MIFEQVEVPVNVFLQGFFLLEATNADISSNNRGVNPPSISNATIGAATSHVALFVPKNYSPQMRFQ